MFLQRYELFTKFAGRWLRRLRRRPGRDGGWRGHSRMRRKLYGVGDWVISSTGVKLPTCNEIRIPDIPCQTLRRLPGGIPRRNGHYEPLKEVLRFALPL